MPTFSVFDDAAVGLVPAVSVHASYRAALRHARFQARTDCRISPTGRDWQAFGSSTVPGFSVWSHAPDGVSCAVATFEQGNHLATVWANITRREP